MAQLENKQLGNTLWKIADDLRGAMNADDFRDYMLSFLMTNANQQHRITSCLSSLDDLIAAETQKLKALKTPKSGLMQQLSPSPESG